MFRIATAAPACAPRRQPRPASRAVLKPLAVALLAAFPPMAPAAPELPDLGTPSGGTQTSFQPGPGGLALDRRNVTSRLTAMTESSSATGAAFGVRGALALGDGAVLGGGVLAGARTHELFANIGLRLDAAQRLVLTGAQLKQKLDFDFPSGRARADMTQNAVGAAWRLQLRGALVDHAELSAYAAQAASRELGAVDYTVDTATLFELWRDPRRIAGAKLAGFQGRLGLVPWEGGGIKVGLGQERLRYDLQGAVESHHRATGSLGLEQALDGRIRLKAGVDAGAAQSGASLGIDIGLGGAGSVGVGLAASKGRDGAPGDTRVQLSWTLPLGRMAGGRGALADQRGAVRGLGAGADAEIGAFSDDTLLDQAATRPGWLPTQVVAKVDASAGPTRLVAVDRTALPAGATVDSATGAIAAPLGVAVAGIAGVTRNGAAFANTGQFSLSGSNLVVNPNLIAQPAVGVVDTYVVTANNVGGGTTLITVRVSHGSVRIESIAVSTADTTPAAFAFVDQIGVALGATVDSAAITVAGINTAASVSISGGQYAISTDAGSTWGAWTGSAGTVLNGNRVKVRVTAASTASTAVAAVLTIGGVSNAFDVTTAAADTAAVVGAPTIAAKTDATLTATHHIADADGVRNVAYFIYSDAAGTALVATNSTGAFTGLTAGATYYVKTTAQTRNATTNAWANQTSTLTSVTLNAADTAAVVGAPTIAAKTHTTLTVTNNIVDADGVRNVAYFIYSDAAGTAQVATNATGSFTGLTAGATYYVKTTAQTKNAASNTWTTQTSSLVAVTMNAADTAAVVGAPTIAAKTDTTLTVTNNIADADGVRNVAYFIYSDAAGTAQVATNATGSFTGLTAGATYYVKTTAQTKNAATNTWTNQASSLVAVTMNGADAAAVVGAPTLGARTNTSLTVTNNIADADGVRNVAYFIYSDAAGTAQVATNGTGSFTGLTAGTTYYAKTTAEAYNAATAAWSLQTSALTAMTTYQYTMAAVDIATAANVTKNGTYTSNTQTVSGPTTAVTLSLSGVPAGVTLMKNGADSGATSASYVAGDTFAVRFVPNAYGQAVNGTITNVTDGNAVVDTFAFTVEANVAPTFTKAADFTMTNGQTSPTKSFTVADGNVNSRFTIFCAGDGVTLNIASQNGASVSDTNYDFGWGSIPAKQFTNAPVGSYSYTVTANQGGGLGGVICKVIDDGGLSNAYDGISEYTGITVNP